MFSVDHVKILLECRAMQQLEGEHQLYATAHWIVAGRHGVGGHNERLDHLSFIQFGRISMAKLNYLMFSNNAVVEDNHNM